MSISVTTPQGQFNIPGAYADFGTQETNSGLATTGVLLLVGEADGGPDYTQELDLDLNSFGPNDLSAVIAKYVSGPIVDGFKGAVSASKDPDITGAPQLIKLVKTNPSAKATLALTKVAGGSYGTLQDNNFGKLGNLFIGSVIAAPAEVVPTTGLNTYISPTGVTTLNVRVDGGGASVVNVTAAMLPSAFATALAAVPNLTVTGGTARGSAPGGGATLAVAIVAGNTITLTSSANWLSAGSQLPVVGDTLVVSATSLIKGAANQNVGAYVVTAVTVNTVTATKLADGAAGVAGVITAPIAVAAVAATTADAEFYQPITAAHVAGNAVDGIGKSLEFFRATGSENLFFVLGTTTPASILSIAATPILLISASEYAVNTTIARASDNVSEAHTVGGEVALTVSYLGTTASMAITGTTAVVGTATVTAATSFSTTVTGGAGVNIPATDLTAFPTLNDLVAFINTFTGYTAKVGSAALGLLPPSALDQVTVSIGASTPSAVTATLPGNLSGRVKIDGFRYFNEMFTSPTVSLAIRAPAGLPAVASGKAFAGGTRAATTQVIFQAAIDALKAVEGNFVVPLFSQNATADILLGLTDAASTYTIDSINSYVLSHCNAMSVITSRKNRQGITSKRDTFANVQVAAQTLAAGRITLAFQDVIASGQNGLAQFQPWMNAAKAAGAQAAAGPKAIFNKLLDLNGAIQNAKDFNFKDDNQVTKAGKAGLLTIRKARGGGFRYVADQTTYSKDQNPVFNSIQAIYAADTVALTTAQRMEDAFVGKTLAQVSSSVAFAFLETIMVDMLKLGFLAKSDGAERGYKDAKISIVGPHLHVDVTIFLATALYFVTIRFQINQVKQTTTQ